MYFLSSLCLALLIHVAYFDEWVNFFSYTLSLFSLRAYFSQRV